MSAEIFGLLSVSYKTHIFTYPFRSDNINIISVIAAIDEENKAAADDDQNQEDDEDYEEEFKGQPKPTKIINQAQSNIPIANPEVEEFKELLEQNVEQLGLKP